MASGSWPRCCGDRRDGAVRRRLVVGRVADRVEPVGAVLREREHAVEQHRSGRAAGRPRPGSRPARRVRPAAGRVPRGRTRPSASVGRPVGEGVVAGKAEQHAERPRGDLRVEPTACVRVRPPRCRAARATGRGRRRPGSARSDTGRSISAPSRGIHSSSCLGATMSSPAAPCGREFEDRLAACRHRAAEAEQFVLGGVRAGHRLAVHGAVGNRCATTRSQARRPRPPPARGAIAAMSSAVAGSLRAPRSPIAYARTAPCATWVPKSTASSRLPITSRYSGKLSQPQVMPSVSAVPGMSSTPSISSISHSSLPGPHRRESDAAVAGDDGGDAVAAGRLEQRVPADLAVVVGVDVDEARRDDLAGGVDRLGGLALECRALAPSRRRTSTISPSLMPMSARSGPRRCRPPRCH